MSDIREIHPEDSAYPSLLKQTHRPPATLYVRGTLPSNDLPSVAIVGSRKCSEYGITAARKISRELGAVGVTIISGMARGIDSAAAYGALEAGAHTVAVLGCGTDICYPSENKPLMDQILETGCIISEFEPGTAPQRHHFPMRNRIISGMSHALVVVEAGEHSGTESTVSHALEQGREVCAVPGSIFNRMSEGTNELLKSGATLVTSGEDVLRALRCQLRQTPLPDRRPSDIVKISSKVDESALAPEEKMIYAYISFEPVAVDEVIRQTRLSAQVVLYTLTKLELQQLIRRVPGQKYMRNI